MHFLKRLYNALFYTTVRKVNVYALKTVREVDSVTKSNDEFSFSTRFWKCVNLYVFPIKIQY